MEARGEKDTMWMFLQYHWPIDNMAVTDMLGDGTRWCNDSSNTSNSVLVLLTTKFLNKSQASMSKS